MALFWPMFSFDARNRASSDRTFRDAKASRLKIIPFEQGVSIVAHATQPRQLYSLRWLF